MKNEKVEIKNPIKSWWSGDQRVEPYMYEVSKTINKYIGKELTKEGRVDIYNRAYEAVYHAIKDFTNQPLNKGTSEELLQKVVENSCDTCEYEKYVTPYGYCFKCQDHSKWQSKVREQVKGCKNCKTRRDNENGLADEAINCKADDKEYSVGICEHWKAIENCNNCVSYDEETNNCPKECSPTGIHYETIPSVGVKGDK